MKALHPRTVTFSVLSSIVFLVLAAENWSSWSQTRGGVNLILAVGSTGLVVIYAAQAANRSRHRSGMD